MSLSFAQFRKFLSDTRGAVTVDYVVITAAATGVALASADLVVAGFGTLSDNVTSELSGTATDANTTTVYNDGFDNGAGGWTGAIATEIFGFGHVLGPIDGALGGAEAVSRSFSVAEGSSKATLNFDVLALDSLDGESGIIYLGGVEVGRVISNHSGTIFEANTTLAGVTVTATVLEDEVQIGGYSVANDWFKDSRVAVSITVDDPTGPLDFGFGSTANQNVEDESFALDNFSVTSTAAVTEEPADP